MCDIGNYYSNVHFEQFPDSLQSKNIEVWRHCCNLLWFFCTRSFTSKYRFAELFGKYSLIYVFKDSQVIFSIQIFNKLSICYTLFNNFIDSFIKWMRLQSRRVCVISTTASTFYMCVRTKMIVVFDLTNWKYSAGSIPFYAHYDFMVPISTIYTHLWYISFSLSLSSMTSIFFVRNLRSVSLFRLFR